MGNFDAFEWKIFPENAKSTKGSAWHKSKVAYKFHDNALQNIDIWVPITAGGSSDEQKPSDTDKLKRPGPWLIYIHGGAWRDPLITSESFSATVRNILSKHPETTEKIGGLASINYTLSPHPRHPTHAALVPADGVETHPSRSGKHPDHILDVLNAIGFLDAQYNMGNNYILAGHSCGATLALQVAMDQALWFGEGAITVPPWPKPLAIVGLNGLYDLPKLISEPGEKHQKLADEYKHFTGLAFGDDESVWEKVSPTSVSDWSKEWEVGKQAMLVQSHEDTLVPYSQTELMFENLRKSAGSNLRVVEADAVGDHNELWQKGDRLAEILGMVVQSLT